MRKLCQLMWRRWDSSFTSEVHRGGRPAGRFSSNELFSWHLHGLCCYWRWGCWRYCLPRSTKGLCCFALFVGWSQSSAKRKAAVSRFLLKKEEVHFLALWASPSVTTPTEKFMPCAWKERNEIAKRAVKEGTEDSDSRNTSSIGVLFTGTRPDNEHSRPILRRRRITPFHSTPPYEGYTVHSSQDRFRIEGGQIMHNQTWVWLLILRENSKEKDRLHLVYESLRITP